MLTRAFHTKPVAGGDDDVFGFEGHPALAGHVGPQRTCLPDAYLLDVPGGRKRQTQVTRDRFRKIVKPRGHRLCRWHWGCPTQTIDFRRQRASLSSCADPHRNEKCDTHDPDARENHSWPARHAQS
jgi:hypothetical protein